MAPLWYPPPPAPPPHTHTHALYANQAAINEIHGSWYDPSNPVVNMAGQLREDLFADLLDWEAKADVCLALGTSMAGMNADRLCTFTSTSV